MSWSDFLCSVRRESDESWTTLTMPRLPLRLNGLFACWKRKLNKNMIYIGDRRSTWKGFSRKAFSAPRTKKTHKSINLRRWITLNAEEWARIPLKLLLQCHTSPARNVVKWKLLNEGNPFVMLSLMSHVEIVRFDECFDWRCENVIDWKLHPTWIW